MQLHIPAQANGVFFYKKEIKQMDEDASAAISRFPDRSHAISDLCARNEGFREMCADFATAEAELQKWRTSTDPRRDLRIGEYRVLTEELAVEIANTLAAAAVVPFPKR